MSRLRILLAPNHPPQELVRRARYIEAAGLDGVWVADHLRGGRHFTPPWYAMTVTLTAIALGTQSLRFGPLVAGMPLRPSAALGLDMATLAELTPGRLLAAIGSGNERDAATTGLSRGNAQELREYVTQVRRSHDQVIVTASTTSSVIVAAEVGTGWVTAGKRPPGGQRRTAIDSQMIDDVAALQAAYRHAGGTGPCLFLHDVMDTSPWSSLQAMRSTITTWTELDFDEVVVFDPEHYGSPSTISYAQAADISHGIG